MQFQEVNWNFVNLKEVINETYNFSYQPFYIFFFVDPLFFGFIYIFFVINRKIERYLARLRHLLYTWRIYFELRKFGNFIISISASSSDFVLIDSSEFWSLCFCFCFCFVVHLFVSFHILLAFLYDLEIHQIRYNLFKFIHYFQFLLSSELISTLICAYFALSKLNLRCFFQKLHYCCDMLAL